MHATPRPQTTPSVPTSVQILASAVDPINHIRTLQILCAAAIGMAALLSFLPAAGHDQLWFLLMARRWLGGASLYGPQIFDSNPPLIVWLSAVPVSIAVHLHLPATTVAKLLVLLAETLSAAISLYLLHRLAPLTRTQLLWLLFASITIFNLVPARDLGQRDHLTAILCLPYVLAAAARHARVHTPLQVTAALLAAIGICLKPHHALIPIAVELTLLALARPSKVSRRLRTLIRPEPPILLLAGLLFLAAIQRFAPAYFSLALPTLHDTYWAIGHLTPFQLLAEAPQLHLLALLTLVLFFRARNSPRPSAFRPAITLLLAAAIAATAAYYLQGTGWYYQQLPAISLFGCALTLQLLNLPARLPDTPWLPRATLALSLLALALTTHFTGYPFTLDRSFAISSPDPTFFDQLAPGTPVAILTTSVDDAMMPVARYHLLWSQRTNNLWTLPAILRSEGSATPEDRGPRPRIPASRLAALVQQQHAWMTEDLTRWQPQLVLVARCQAPEIHCQELEDRHDNLLAWFQRDPAFGVIWQRYRYLRTSGAYDAYTLHPEN